MQNDNEVILPDSKEIFISHASEDKGSIVVPLISALENAGISCWYDDTQIGFGQSVSTKVNEGLSRSRYVLIVFSSNFLKKKFALEELDAAIFKMASEGKDNILPLMATEVEDEIKLIIDRYPLLARKKWIQWKGEPLALINPIKKAISRNIISRVCFISSEYPPHVIGGLGVHVKQLTDALSKDIDLEIILPDLGYLEDEYDNSNSKVKLKKVGRYVSYSIPGSWMEFSKYAAEYICRLDKKDQPEIIHCHDWVTVLAGIKCKYHLNLPLVFHLHLPNRRPLCAAIENLGLVCADLITVNSEAMRTELGFRGFSLPGVVEVIKNGVNLELFKSCENWPEEGNYILFVGRLVEQKGVEYLLRAFYFVNEKFKNVRLKIVGEGGYKDMLVMLSQNLIISQQVDFLEWKSGEDLVQLYQKALMVIVPSIYEPFGMIALEAMACKRPVIVSKVGGLQEIIQHNVTGFHAQPKDDLDLAQWIMALLSNSELRKELGEAGEKQITQEGYVWPIISNKYVQLYEHIREKRINNDINAKAQEFKQQIIDVAKKDQIRIQPFADFLNTLFK